MITEADIENWFTYHPPVRDQMQRYVRIRSAAKEFGRVILESTVPSADQTAAMRTLRRLVMEANQAIACEPEPKD